MPEFETIGRTHKVPEISPRYMQRRAGDDKAVSEHRKGFVPAVPAGAGSSQYGRRATDDKSAAAIADAQARATTPPSALLTKSRELPRVDEATPDLRRRIVEAGGAIPERERRSGARSIIIGLVVVLLLVAIGAVVFR